MRAEVIGVPDTEVSVRLDAAAVEALNLGERWAADVRKRLPLSYYADGLLSPGQAARLCRIDACGVPGVSARTPGAGALRGGRVG